MEVLDKQKSEVAAYQPFYAQLIDLEKKNETLVFSYETPKGNKEARSHVHSLRLTKGALEKVRKESKAESLRVGRLVDSEAAEIEARIDAMIKVHQIKLDEIERCEIERKNKLQGRLDALKEIHRDKTVADYKYHLETLDAVVIDNSWKEFETEALHARAASIAKHREILANLEKHIAEQAELAKLRQEAVERAQKERDEAIAREAVERSRREAALKAEQEAEKSRKTILEAETRVKIEREAAERREFELKMQAEDAERRRLLAEQKAIQDAKDAADRAEKAKQAAIQAEKDRVAAQAKAEADAQAKREANKAHLGKVNRTALAALVEGGISEECAKECIRLIALGKVPNVTINY